MLQHFPDRNLIPLYGERSSISSFRPGSPKAKICLLIFIYVFLFENRSTRLPQPERPTLHDGVNTTKQSSMKVPHCRCGSRSMWPPGHPVCLWSNQLAQAERHQVDVRPPWQLAGQGTAPALPTPPKKKPSAGKNPADGPDCTPANRNYQAFSFGSVTRPRKSSAPEGRSRIATRKG